MACAEGGCHSCAFGSYDHMYGEMWCRNEGECPKGIKNRKIIYQERKFIGGMN